MSSYKNINAFDKYGGFRNRGGGGPNPTADGPPAGGPPMPSMPPMPPMMGPPRPARPRLRLPSTFNPVPMPPAVADDGKSSGKSNGGRRKRKTHRRKAKKSKKAHKTRRR